MSEEKFSRSCLYWWAICCAVTLATIVVADIELRRVAAGNLCLLSMPWDSVASDFERHDAIHSAKEHRFIAPVAVGVIGLVIAATGPIVLAEVQKPRGSTPKTIIVFSAAVLADMLSTIWFFHVQGIDFEFHPGIRLFGYAYGRTVGPIAGKLIQAAGVLYVSVLLTKHGSILIYVVSTAYFIAAIFNVFHTLAATN